MAPDPGLTARLERLLLERLHLKVPSASTDLIAGGFLDSLSLVELLLALEEEMAVRIKIDDLEIDNFRTLANLAQFIAARAGGGRSSLP
jgi:acyl carrier protein